MQLISSLSASPDAIKIITVCLKVSPHLMNAIATFKDAQSKTLAGR